MMRDVVRRGSGAMAWREMRRGDLSGKTGTTSDELDAWFSGFNADIVATAWVGFDDQRPLGRGEQGGLTAIPMWIQFMKAALDGQPERMRPRPPGIVEVRINPKNGLVASDATRDTIIEKFRFDHVPEHEPDPTYTAPRLEAAPSGEPIF
jgi:penicillin-binding protein 1A